MDSVNQELLNISLAFLEGFALIISPCILPILPIILSGSLEGGKKRPFGIIFGFVLAFALFTFFSRQLVQSLGIDLNIIRNLSFGFLILFGIIMISDTLTNLFSQFTSKIFHLDSVIKGNNQTQQSFFSGVFFGSLIGLVWTPCAGPILAIVIVQSVLQKTNLFSFFTILSFGLGAAIPMLIIALLGRKVMEKLSFFRKNAVILRKFLGLLIVLSALFLIFGNSVAFSLDKEDPTKAAVSLKSSLSNPYPAPAITGITTWINSKPLELRELKGKVILIDFWAYSCINCIRTLPYLKSWDQKYRDQGLVIIGMHSPEFDFEKDYNNVKKAVDEYNIHYPVALDNNFSTWQNYHNQYWPAHYLIDKNGYVVYQHAGEGQYDVTENNIQALLGMQGPYTQASEKAGVSFFQTPETYLGYQRQEKYYSPETIVRDQPSNYSFPNQLPRNAWALNGLWNIGLQKIVATKSGSSIKIHFNAAKVYAVMGSKKNTTIPVKVMLNGELVIAEKGKDIKDSHVVVNGDKLYSLIELENSASGILELISEAPGLEIYTFTFGS